jgi:signal peptidase
VIVWLLLALGLLLLGAYHLRAARRLITAGFAMPTPASAGFTGEETARQPRLSLSAVTWTAAGATTALLLALFSPYLVGGNSFTVMSGSMTPAIRTGDVVVVQRVPARDARVGDVITFRDPEGSHRLITHRVRRLRIAANGTVSFVTKGDNANAVQRWSVTGDGSIGLARVRIPFLGYALWGTRQPLGRLVLVIIPALLLAASEVRRLWRPRPSQQNDVPAEAPDAWSV